MKTTLIARDEDVYLRSNGTSDGRSGERDNRSNDERELHCDESDAAGM